MLAAAAIGTIGLVVVVAAGLAWTLARRRRKRWISTESEVLTRLGVPAIGVLPRIERGRRPPHLVRDEPHSAYAKAAHAALTAVQATPPAIVLLVTSALPGEGKTTAALSLAVAAAAAGRTLVIDLDLRQPNVHRILDQEPSRGLIEHVSGAGPVSEVIRHDPRTGLDFIPVGLAQVEPTELVESERLAALLEVCRGVYDAIVIDSAPVGIITDTRLAARLADRVLFVVQWGQTPVRAAQEGIKALCAAGIEPAGVVLTQAKPSRR
jgi:polysaccharide biosynthesis transport protein